MRLRWAGRSGRCSGTRRGSVGHGQRSRRTQLSLPPGAPFATWSNLTMVTVAYVFASGGALLAGVFNRVSQFPVLCVVIGCFLTLGFVVPPVLAARPQRHLRRSPPGEENAAHTPSPVCLNHSPPCDSIARRNTVSCAASAASMSSESASHRRDDPSMSVNRYVNTLETPLLRLCVRRHTGTVREVWSPSLHP